MYWLQHRINFIASFLLTYENPRGFFLVRILFAKFTSFKTATFLTQSRYHQIRNE